MHTWQVVNLCPGPDDEHDGVEPESEHEGDDDDVLDGDGGEVGDAPGRRGRGERGRGGRVGSGVLVVLHSQGREGRGQGGKRRRGQHVGGGVLLMIVVLVLRGGKRKNGEDCTDCIHRMRYY